MAAVSSLGNIFEDVAIKAPVRLASTVANITLNGLPVIDGVAVAAGDRILVAAQADQTTNGVYQASTGPWIRTADADGNTDFIDGTLVSVARGNVNAGLFFQLQCTDSPIVIGSSLLVFTLKSAVAAAQASATSTSSLTVGTGSKTFAIPAGKAFSAGQYVLAYETSNPVNAMVGSISSYAGSSLVVSMTATGGSGTHADWTIVLVNSVASAGLVPPIGTGNVTGPGSSASGHLATFADGTGKVLADSGIVLGALASRTTLLYGDAGTATIPQSALVPGSAPLPFCGSQPNDNLHLVNDATNPTRDINVTPGRCRSDDDATNLHLVGNMVKRLDTAWAAGSAAGGCDTGTKGAGQTWHQFLIAKRALAITSFSRTSNVASITVAAHGGGAGGTVRVFGIGSAMDALAAITSVTTNTISYANSGPDIGATSVSAMADLYDVLASQNYAAPTLPSGWTSKQCLGSFVTDGSANIYAVTQIGDEFLLGATQILNLSGLTTSALLVICPGLPLGVKVLALLRGDVTWATGQSGYVLFSSPDETDQGPNVGVAQFAGSGNASFHGEQSGEFICRTDTSRQIRSRANGSFNTAAAGVRGWRDPRRRLF